MQQLLVINDKRARKHMSRGAESPFEKRDLLCAVRLSAIARGRVRATHERPAHSLQSLDGHALHARNFGHVFESVVLIRKTRSQSKFSLVAEAAVEKINAPRKSCNGAEDLPCIVCDLSGD